MTKKFNIDFAGRDLEVEVGHLAGQANGQAFVKYGDTSLLATAAMSNKTIQANYLPLSVEYQEKFFAAGKIKGSKWVKREGRPSDEAILAGRLIDRALRPRFNQRIRNEIQVIITVLSFDNINDPDVIGLFAASLALMISDIPFDGPVAGVRVGKANNEYVLNPSYKDREKSDFDIVVAGTKDRINMLEGGINIVKENIILDAIEFGHRQLNKILEFQEKIKKEAGIKKADLGIKPFDENLVKEIESATEGYLEKAVYSGDKSEMKSALADLRESMFKKIKEKYSGSAELDQILKDADLVFEEKIDGVIHKKILEKKQRPDGRKLDEIRPLKAEVDFLPRTHGSGIFNRGSTQTLSILTLGSPGAEQWIETMEMEDKKSFMHHYEFPPFAPGEVGRVGFTNRREIGHGALVEKSLLPVIPNKKDFPYTIRIVSEVLSSNGSTSMASICSSTLALMDGGVPISAPVVGISMGLIMSDDEENYGILTDIQGPEDHHGDMDLKLAGTKEGLTVIQMDVKVEGVKREILEKSFREAKKAREKIFEVITSVLSRSRGQVSKYAPKIFTLQINPDKIRNVIGPQGKVINEIIAQTGATIDIEDSGLVFVTSESEDSVKKAIAWIKDITKEIKVGEVFKGKVKKIVDFGAFVEIAPGQDGLVHASEFNQDEARRAVGEIIKVSDIITVKVKNIDEFGRINLSLVK